MAMEFAKQVVGEYRWDNCPMMAAGLAFCAVFSIPPLLFVLVNGAETPLGAAWLSKDSSVKQVDCLGRMQQPSSLRC